MVKAFTHKEKQGKSINISLCEKSNKVCYTVVEKQILGGDSMTNADRLLEKMTEKRIESLFLNNSTNIRYITGYSGENIYLLIANSGKWLITDRKNQESIQNIQKEFQIINFDSDKTTIGACVNDLLDRHQITLMGFERNHINYGLIQDMELELEYADVIPTVNLVESIVAL